MILCVGLNKKGLIIYHSKRILSFIFQKYIIIYLPKGYYHLSFQKDIIVCHFKGVLLLTISNGYYHLPFQMGIIIYHSKWVLSFAIPKRYYYSTFQKGISIYHSKGVLSFTILNFFFNILLVTTNFITLLATIIKILHYYTQLVYYLISKYHTFDLAHAMYFSHHVLDQFKSALKPQSGIQTGSTLEVLVLELTAFWLHYSNGRISFCS